MTKEILDKLVNNEEFQEAIIHCENDDDDSLIRIAQAALEVFKEYVVFLEEGAEPQEGEFFPCAVCGCEDINILMDTEYGGWECWGVECNTCDFSPTPRQTDKSRSFDQFIYPVQERAEAVIGWNERYTERNGKPVVMLPKVGE